MSLHDREDHRRLTAGLRWAASGLLVLTVHAAAIALLVRQPEAVSTATGGEPVMEVDLQPVEGEQANDEMPPSESSGDPATAAAAAADSAASVDAPPPAQIPPSQHEAPKVEPEPPPPPEPRKVEPEPPPPPAPEPQKIEAPPLPRLSLEPPKTDLPPRPPPPPEPPKVEPQPPEVEPAPPSRAAAASTPASAVEEAMPTVQRLSAGREVAWRGALVAHLNRFRRFPRELGGGTARIGFTIDAEGRVMTIRVVIGSGTTALDEAAVSLIRRASPFPKPPADVSGERLSFVVPIHFDGRQP